MTRNWMAILALAGGIQSVTFAQQYPQQYPQQNSPYQGDPNYNGQYGDDQYDNGQYAGDPGYAYDQDPGYADDQGVYAPAPPPVPSYAYQRPPMPGPGYSWVDGYWNFLGGRYSWVGGYWMLPPYTGGYWIAPRYSSGRFFAGHWGGRPGFNRGFVRNSYRFSGSPAYRRGFAAPRGNFRSPAQNRFRGNDGNRSRSGGSRQHGNRR